MKSNVWTKSVQCRLRGFVRRPSWTIRLPERSWALFGPASHAGGAGGAFFAALVQASEPQMKLSPHWYERNTGQAVKGAQRRVRHPVLRWMGATLV